MKTLTAILLHVGIGAAQVVLPFSDRLLSGTRLPAEAEMPIQVGLLALQAIIAKRNSDTDPFGNRLARVDDGKWVSVPPLPVPPPPGRIR